MARLSALRLSLCWRLETLAFACSAAWSATAPSEYQVKAVFLFNFAHFVSWPADTFRRPDAPFVIGILGTDPFGSTLDDVVRGETIERSNVDPTIEMAELMDAQRQLEANANMIKYQDTMLQRLVNDVGKIS